MARAQGRPSAPHIWYPARRCPGGSGPARSGLSQPGPPAPHRVDLAAFLPAPARRPGAELIQPVAWMPLGPNHDLRRQFAGFIFISAAPPRAGEPALCLLPVQPPPRPPGCRVDSPFSSLFLPWAPPAPSPLLVPGAWVVARAGAGGGGLGTCSWGPVWRHLSELSLTPHTWSPAPCQGHRHWPGRSCP